MSLTKRFSDGLQFLAAYRRQVVRLLLGGTMNELVEYTGRSGATGGSIAARLTSIAKHRLVVSGVLRSSRLRSARTTPPSGLLNTGRSPAWRLAIGLAVLDPRLRTVRRASSVGNFNPALPNSDFYTSGRRRPTESVLRHVGVRSLVPFRRRSDLAGAVANPAFDPTHLMAIPPRTLSLDRAEEH
jgi:hypothetical protein